MSDKKKTVMNKIEDLQSAVLAIISKVDELKDTLQKNANLEKFKSSSQEFGKKYMDKFADMLPFKNYYDKFKANDYAKLAKQIKEDLEGKFNVGMDQLLNTFGISSVEDNKEILKKFEEFEKDIKKLEKDIKKLKKDLKEKKEKKESKK